MGAGLEVAILGPLQVDVVGRRLTLGGARQRAVLASLVIRSGGVVPAAMVIGDVWGLDAPIGALHSLQQHLSELRKLLAAPDLLRTHEGGYQLVVGALDADEFEDLVRAGTDAATAGRHDEALEHRERALGRWRGSVLVDVPESPAIRSVATRLDEMRSAVEEDRIDSLLSLGRPRDAVALLEPLVHEHPYRERLRGQQMLALYR
ncbi:MAG: AfsR/SARP family transcriptional regulator, partial [Actinobacteria bacterium]|nr:AfsR/SARP family transcriptional regulator [Actinomycetota bacterium]